MQSAISQQAPQRDIKYLQDVPLISILKFWKSSNYFLPEEIVNSSVYVGFLNFVDFWII